MIRKYSSIAITSLSLLLSSTAYSDDQLPEDFSKYEWLLDGAREVIRRETDFAPVTSCIDLNRKFAGEATSSIQKERAWEDYEGKLIPLTGIVEEVKRIPLTHDYLAFFKCPNSESFMVDFTVEIPQEMEEYAFELTPGEREDIYVRLTDYGDMMGVSTEIDAFELETSNGESCFSYLSTMSRSPDEYKYSCYENEENTRFENYTKEAKTSQILSSLKTDDEIVIFSTSPEDVDTYLAFIKNGEESKFYSSDSENKCVITASYLKENREWATNILKEIKPDLFAEDNQGNINDWHIALDQHITSSNNQSYTCEQIQVLRGVIFTAYISGPA
ncbi:hypothetical protein ACUN9Y_18465 [Halomonas sp. V046]|uniref:hypothetical protein n=1 Tax=Halomonas sp. V046 TaxID=3459611 RepID=UPI0040446D23